LSRASSFVIAASFFSLFDSEKARECFWAASQEYRQLSRPFALTLGVCSTKPEGLDGSHLTEQLRDGPSFEAPADYYFYKLAYDFWLYGPKTSSDVFYKLENLGMDRQLVGRLGLPMNLYKQVYRSAFSSPNSDMLITPIADLLNRVVEITHAAMQDKFHWQRLYSTILPVEPEILATLLSVIAKMHDRDAARTLKESLSGRVDPIGVAYMSIASEMLGYRDEPLAQTSYE
jgi:hypothetical protein